VYGWIWHKLPGGTGGKCVLSVLLALAAIAILMLIAFPWLETHLPFGEVTVGK
jgi:hypothetical protein